jgi:para-nitrobenzyl esterase
MTHGWNRRGVLGASFAASMLPAIGARAQALSLSTIPVAPFVVAETTAGKVRGGTARGALSFKGIPYAGSVSGANRFKAAPPVTPWTGVRDALRLGAPTMQTPHSTYGQDEPAYSEDCLYLNVWTPATDGKKRPVMVYLHGGGYSTGSAGSTAQDGGRMAAVHDVVVVAPNHRLGLLGFLWLGDALGADYATSGNQGMLDIIAALRWVRDNIAQFGGDPGNVTIFGESGGGAKVGTLLGMPQAKGLFHKAGIQSGAQLKRMPRAAAAETTQRLLRALGVTDARRLMDIPVQTLLELQWQGEKGQGPLAQPTPGYIIVPESRESFGEDQVAGKFAPVIDGHYLPADPVDPMVTPLAADIPLLIANNKEEARFFFMGQPEVFSLDAAGLKARLQPMLGARTDEMIAVYSRLRPGATPSDLFIAITTAATMGNETVTLADRKAAQPAPVYRYRWDYDSNLAIAGTATTLGSGHATDIGPTFLNWDQKGLHGSGPGVAQASAHLSAVWAGFARTGKPAAPGVPDWPRYETTKRPVMLIDVDCTLADDPDAEARVLWNKA